jgi:hypothetical protein
VRRVDGTSWDIERPAGVAFSLQVRLHSVEPAVPSRSRDLLAHKDSRPEAADEPEHFGPEVSLVIGASSLS